jgi:S1-C subfamily serine protease
MTSSCASISRRHDGRFRTAIACVAIAMLGACQGLGKEDDKPEAEAKAEDAKSEAKAEDSSAPPSFEATLTKAEPPKGAQTPIVNPEKPSEPVQTPAVDPPPPDARTSDEHNSIDVFEAAAPATVFVTQKRTVEDFAMREYEVDAGAGTGFIWDADGHIVTNCHVAMADCPRQIAPTKLTVTLHDHKTYDAEVVGVDVFKDIAVLKISTTDKLVPIRQPPKGHTLTVGQKAIAIGNPFGLDHTLTVGVISALGREVRGIGDVTIRDMVQTDAAINPGNSGGPLLDSQAQIIGMNTMIFSRSGSSAGIGFAVPYGAIAQSVPQIIKHGKPIRVGLGISKLDDAMSTRLGVDGVVVNEVARESPAFAAGLRGIVKSATGFQFDTIVGIGKKRVRIYDDLFTELEGKNPGDKVELQIMRMPDKKVFTVETELIEL